jgi:prephenate dehydrogenase
MYPRSRTQTGQREDVNSPGSRQMLEGSRTYRNQTGAARERRVVVVGGDGEFGSFLRLRILPALSVVDAATIEGSTPMVTRRALLSRAAHVVLSTPLAGYREAARALVHECSASTAPVTLWFIPSVQREAWDTVVEELLDVANPLLSAVMVHPMYGPRGFAATEPGPRRFRNILTGVHAGESHPIWRELVLLRQAFRARLGIETVDEFGPHEHDRITAASQGLAYCVAQAMFEDPDLDREIGERLPDLHRSFHVDRPLILEFMRASVHMPGIARSFAARRREASESGLASVLEVFRGIDRELNGEISAIPTRWYLRLRSAPAED